MSIENENKRLRAIVQQLLDRIEENQRIQEHFHQFEFKLLSATGLQDLLHLLLDDACRHFRLASSSVFLLDEDGSLEGLITSLGIDHYQSRLQLRSSPEFYEKIYTGEPRVTLQEVDVLTSTRLFPGAPNVGSAALLPLIRQHRLVGSLHLASSEATRFTPDKSADFLSHLSSLIVMCLQNSISWERLELQGQLDTLTGVGNRRYFDRAMEQELDRANRNHGHLSCLFIDADHFKHINDTFGHMAGDLCLQFLAKRIGQQLRKTDILCRYGGEEFIVLMPGTESKQAILIAERIRHAVAQESLTMGEQTIPLTVSAGVSTWKARKTKQVLTPEELSENGKALVERADKAMYAAKQNGRNCVAVEK
ncbi:GGDEF domain-containing protein [Marinibactrum halimedae]|nr:DUF484 family protein [Marinibactrum halimedae]MCD9458711.1 sensor domain-containing diguanylate cyclase [Marinibactrum halimedae]